MKQFFKPQKPTEINRENTNKTQEKAFQMAPNQVKVALKNIHKINSFENTQSISCLILMKSKQFHHSHNEGQSFAMENYKKK